MLQQSTPKKKADNKSSSESSETTPARGKRSKFRTERKVYRKEEKCNANESDGNLGKYSPASRHDKTIENPGKDLRAQLGKKEKLPTHTCPGSNSKEKDGDEWYEGQVKYKITDGWLSVKRPHLDYETSTKTESERAEAQREMQRSKREDTKHK